MVGDQLFIPFSLQLLSIVLMESVLICPFQDGWTPLHLAVQARRTDIVKLLLIKGANKTLKNRVNINLFLSTCIFIYRILFRSSLDA